MDDMLEMKDKIEGIYYDIHGLKSLIHLTLEAIRGDSVEIDEVISVVASLLMLAEIITDRMGNIKEEFVPEIVS